MADGVNLPLTGSGDTTAKAATDDCGAPGHAQIIKQAISTDGSATLIPSDAANGLDVDVTRVQGAATPSISRVATSTTSAQLLASAPTRKGAVIYNDSTGTLYIKFGTTASATSFTYILAAAGTLELPVIAYTGRVDGILSAGSGNAQVTELS